MTIKLIATDMDGTFLNSQNDYNRPRFQKLYQKMKEKGVKFVVASGNQYYQLKSFFPEIEDEISFAAENGSYVVAEGKEIFVAKAPDELVKEVLDILQDFAGAKALVCGKNSAYMQKGQSQELLDYMGQYYYRLKEVDDLHKVIEEDQIFKLALHFPEDEIDAAYKVLEGKLAGKMDMVISGFEDIDLLTLGVHKADGIDKLAAIWNIKPEEMAAFGDSDNDLEMLKYVKHSFAMSNARDTVKEVSSQTIASNDEDAVLDKIEELLEEM